MAHNQVKLKQPTLVDLSLTLYTVRTTFDALPYICKDNFLTPLNHAL